MLRMRQQRLARRRQLAELERCIVMRIGRLQEHELAVPIHVEHQLAIDMLGTRRCHGESQAT